MRTPAEDRFQRIVEGLSALTAPTATPPPLDELIGRVVAQAQEATHAGGAVLELVEGAELMAIAASGSLAARGGHRRHVGAGASGRAIAAQALQLCADTWADLLRRHGFDLDDLVHTLAADEVYHDRIGLVGVPRPMHHSAAGCHGGSS